MLGLYFEVCHGCLSFLRVLSLHEVRKMNVWWRDCKVVYILISERAEHSSVTFGWRGYMPD